MATPFRVLAEPRTRADNRRGHDRPRRENEAREESSSDRLTAACRASGVRTVSASPTEAMPRLANRLRRALRPSSSRRFNVPSDQPSCLAASSRVKPER